MEAIVRLDIPVSERMFHGGHNLGDQSRSRREGVIEAQSRDLYNNDMDGMKQMRLLEEKITRNVPGDLQEHILAEIDGVMSASALSLLEGVYYVSYLEFSDSREKQSSRPAARGVPPTEDGVTVRYQQRMGESTLQAAMNYYHIVFAMLDEIKEPEERLHGKDLIEKKIANARKHDLFDEYNSLVESEAGSRRATPSR
jgi:hypothetical protein